MRGIGELIREGERSFSFEFFPPKDEAGEEQLWRAISALEPYRPTFVSVTYGAGGSTRDTTVRVTGRIASETSLPVASSSTSGSLFAASARTYPPLARPDAGAYFVRSSVGKAWRVRMSATG